MPGKVILEVARGPIQGKVYTFEEHDTFIFGRSPGCHAQLPENDPTASRKHFILEVNPPDARIRDLGSLNGTYINNTKHGGRNQHETPEDASNRAYPEVDLKDGDAIRVGETVFKVQVDLPAICCECGRDIPEGFEETCQWIGKNYICPKCRKKVEQGGSKPKAPEPMRCNQCGKDVTSEVSNRRGEYTCQACQKNAQSNPLVAMVKMLMADAQGQSMEDQIAGYEIVKMLGQGGMGAVYLARRNRDNAMVALKVMLAKVAVDENSRKTFLREIEVTKALRHRNIVELYESGSAGSGFYFALEFCPGGGLDDLIKKRGGKMALSEAAPLMLQMLDGLAFAHEQGFVHRDLKPANILLTDKEGGTAKVADLGLAKNFQKAGFSGMTATGAYGGTPVFMPREQLTDFKYAKPVSDVWSIGATFYQMLSGQFPRDFRRGVDPMAVILMDDAVPIRNRDSSVPKNIAEVIDRALLDDDKKRYQSAGELRRELSRVL